jgi:hypothetical protein
MTKKYYSNGINVKPYFHNGEYIWHVYCKFRDYDSQNILASEGRIENRYSIASLTEAIDNVKRDVEELGILWCDIEGMTATIYMHLDGCDKTIAYPPNWRWLIAAQCERLGWRCLYD